jgi:hypothetical protein
MGPVALERALEVTRAHSWAAFLLGSCSIFLLYQSIHELLSSPSSNLVLFQRVILKRPLKQTKAWKKVESVGFFLRMLTLRHSLQECTVQSIQSHLQNPHVSSVYNDLSLPPTKTLKSRKRTFRTSAGLVYHSP